MIRVGKVVSTNTENCTCKVQFVDMDNFISTDLQVLQQKTHKDKYYYMPDIDEMVVCLLDDRSGIIFGSIYNRKNLPTFPGQNLSGVEYKDGSKITFDSDSGELFADVKGNINITNKSTEITSESSFSITNKTTEIKSNDIKLGNGANYGVIHSKSPCPIYGVCHLKPSTVTKTAE